MQVITGPNMGGKSTYMRQVALIVLLASIGSHVPAASCRLGPIDAIHTRIGAADDLANAQSTFMLEMLEAAQILHAATPHSLVLMDEIGRGTSTFDGLALAGSIATQLHDKTRAFTLFATHYFELTELPAKARHAVNMHVSAAESGSDIVFLHEIAPGPASRSYGIQVAKLAGMPAAVLNHARHALEALEARAGEGKLQVDLFAPPPAPEMLAPSRVEAALAALDPDKLSPREANEEQGAQSHFLDLCDLLGVPKPGSESGYRFEEKAAVLGDARGYADVFKRNAFAWENKAPGKNLDAALRQLLTYSLALSNPPLLVVCDRLIIRVHTQFNGHPSETHLVRIDQLDQPDKLALLRRIWTQPESFRPSKTNRDITEAAARSFATLAEQLRQRGHHADQVAHFLTQCLFCFFAEDVGLLPGRMFEGLVNNRQLTSEKLTTGFNNLFNAMRDGGLYGNDDIPWFNGGLFKRIEVPPLTVLEVTELRNAAALNWSAIDVSIFGTLFERGLDPAKRSQLGAHYTDPATILRIVEPVVQRPLLQNWEQVAQQIRGLMAKSTRRGDKSHRAAQAAFITWLDQLSSYRVLDPACGSGNFLFLGLKVLKDIEHRSHIEAANLGLDRQQDLVTGPHNVLGIELNEYAAELARVTVWIGELQWRIEHGYPFKTNPVLEPLDHIECRDECSMQSARKPTSSRPGAMSRGSTTVPPCACRWWHLATTTQPT
jgi:hypothetical protein